MSPQSHPHLFPSRWDVLAYHINTYNALAMYAVIANNIPVALDSFAKRLRFFTLTTWQIGGQRLSLYDYENAVIRPLGESRVHVALNCMATSCPCLPRVPFAAKTLDRQLTEAAVEFFDNPKHFPVWFLQPAAATLVIVELRLADQPIASIAAAQRTVAM